MRALVVVLLSLLIAGCSNNRTVETLTPASEQSAPQTRRQVELSPLTPTEDGRNIFVANCIGCHGKNADGDTPAGRNWRVPSLHSAQIQSKSDEALLQSIRQGRGKMPSWSGLLSQADMDHLLAYIRTLKAPEAARR